MNYKRAVPSVVIGLAGVVLMSIGLVHVVKIGTCASGNTPFLIARPCPSGTGGDIGLLVGGVLLATVGMIIGGISNGGLLVWCALFLGSGTALLVTALTAHDLTGGAKSAGYIIGAIFIPMGGLPLIWMLTSGVGSLRQKRLRARSKEADATVSRVDELQRYGFNQAKIRVTYAVQPLDDASFEVSRETNVLISQMPHTGQHVKVRYDPDDRERFEVETPSLGDNLAAVAAMTQGGRTPAAAQASLDAVVRAAAAQATSGVAGFPGVPAIPAIPGVPSATSGSPFGKRDPLDRLKELAELRDSGALTSAEFDAQKAKILAET